MAECQSDESCSSSAQTASKSALCEAHRSDSNLWLRAPKGEFWAQHPFLGTLCSVMGETGAAPAVKSCWRAEIPADVGLFALELQPVSAVTKAVAGKAGDPIPSPPDLGNALITSSFPKRMIYRHFTLGKTLQFSIHQPDPCSCSCSPCSKWILTSQWHYHIRKCVPLVKASVNFK